MSFSSTCVAFNFAKIAASMEAAVTPSVSMVKLRLGESDMNCLSDIAMRKIER